MIKAVCPYLAHISTQELCDCISFFFFAFLSVSGLHLAEESALNHHEHELRVEFNSLIYRGVFWFILSNNDLTS